MALQEPDDVKITRYLNSLLEGHDISFDEKTDVIGSLHKPKVRAAVSIFLQEIQSPKLIDNPVALKTLGELLKYLLTAFLHEKEDDIRVIMAIMASA